MTYTVYSKQDKNNNTIRKKFQALVQALTNTN